MMFFWVSVGPGFVGTGVKKREAAKFSLAKKREQSSCITLHVHQNPATWSRKPRVVLARGAAPLPDEESQQKPTLP